MHRLKPEPALCREVFVDHFDIGDEEAVLKDFACEVMAEHVAQWRVRAIAADEPVGFHRVGAIGGHDLKHHVVVFDRDAINAVFATDFDRRTCFLHFKQPLDHKAFEIGLLEVDEGGEFVAFFWQKIEFEYFVFFVKDFSEVPDYTLFDHGLACAVAVGNFEGAFGKTNRAAAHADTFVIIKHDDRDALGAQIKRCRDTDGATAHDHNRVAHGRAFVLVGVALVWVEAVSECVAVIKHVSLLL